MDDRNTWYHCENSFDKIGWKDTDGNVDIVGSACGGFNTAQRPSTWLASLISRQGGNDTGRAGPTIKGWPGSSSAGQPTAESSERPRVLDLGCGLGQDSRNLARAGFTVTGVDVSLHAIEVARSLTLPSDGETEFVAYDALALPEPRVPLTFIFDATVYCTLRLQYLNRLYALWRKLLPPGGPATMLVQCWMPEVAFHDVREAEMDYDFAGAGLTIVHKEGCIKNQDLDMLRTGEQHTESESKREIDAYCYYLRRDAASSAPPPSVDPPEMSFYNKVGRLRDLLSIDAATPIPAAIKQANQMMGLPDAGTLPQQADEVLRRIFE